jgi:glycolate oxidase iron-sulfur subunit
VTTAAKPRAAKPLAGADLCVHCGFCLQACPTYLTLDDENDSPRGRIVLMKALADGELDALDADVTQHIDQCLGCRACETACPSGVPYGQLLEESRATIATQRPLSVMTRVLLYVFADPTLSAIVFGAGRVVRVLGIASLLSRLPGRIGIAMATLAATRRSGSRDYAARAGTPERANVAVLTGCVMEGLLSPVNRATDRTLAFNGYRLVNVAGQKCCGALHAHAGASDAARDLARANIAAFEASGAEFIAVNSAGCGSAMKEYGHLLAGDPLWCDRAEAFSRKVRDVSELLAASGPIPASGEPIQLAIDHPCHQQHAQRLSGPPAAVYVALTGTERTELPDASSCCGAAGLYSMENPDLSQRILAPKLANIAASGASCVATGNPGCMMHIGAGLRRAGSSVTVRHPVELLDEAYAREANR